MADMIRKDRRGLGSASAETRRRVAAMGGKAYHEKRGARGTDGPVKKEAK